jgi:hypothetical protein
MAQIQVSNSTLSVRFEGIDRLLSLKRGFTIPLDHVVSVEPRPRTERGDSGLRVLATRVPAVMAPKTFHEQSGRRLFDGHDPNRTLVIGVYDERYSRLVLEVDDPEGAADAITQAVRAA